MNCKRSKKKICFRQVYIVADVPHFYNCSLFIYNMKFTIYGKIPLQIGPDFTGVAVFPISEKLPFPFEYFLLPKTKCVRF